jgi:predicted nuclease of predicted toxin-antitoxin system
MLLYADEDFPLGAVVELRLLGHDVLRVQEDGRRGRPDNEVLQRAHELGRVVLTHNRDDFELLHRGPLPHSGIVSASQGMTAAVLAARVHERISSIIVGRRHLRVNRLSA